jgi:hypothetical protein
MTDKPKLLILGYGRHGKDTVAEFLQDDYGFKFTSSSLFVAKEVMWDNWGCAKYPTFEAMFEDRSNHRVTWMEMISAYNTPDKTKTATTMLERGFDLYVGMRRLDELEACKAAKIFDAIIWVDASERHPPETGSMDITLENSGADFVIDNNGPEEAIVDEIVRLMDWLKERGIEVVPVEEPNIFADMPPHPWDKMSPVEVLADWLGTKPEVLDTAEGQCNFPIPVRAQPELGVLERALKDLNGVLWYDPIDPAICFKRIIEQAEEDTDPDPWEPVFIFLSNFPDDDNWVKKLFLEEGLADFEDGGPIWPETHPVGTNGPEAVMPVFKSTRSKVGQLETVETTTEGVTTIINIENVYMVGGDD